MKRTIVTLLIAATALVGMSAVASARPGNRGYHRNSSRTHHARRARTPRQVYRRPVYRRNVYRRNVYRPQRRVYRTYRRPVYRPHRYRAPRHVTYDRFGRRVVGW